MYIHIQSGSGEKTVIAKIYINEYLAVTLADLFDVCIYTFNLEVVKRLLLQKNTLMNTLQ